MPPFRKKCWFGSSLALLALNAGFSLPARGQSQLQPQPPPSQAPEAQGTAAATLSSFVGQLAPGLAPQTSGIRVSVSTFIPSLGLLDGDISGFATTPGFRNSLSYVRLSKIRWGNERIEVTGGDFLVNPIPLSGGDDNTGNQSLQIAGAKAELKGAHHRVRVYAGREIISEGIGIPLVYSANQTVAGADGAITLAHGLVVGGHALWLSAQDGNIFGTTPLLGGQLLPVPSSTSGAVDLQWHVIHQLTLAADIGVSKFFTGADSKWHPASLVKAAWDSHLFTAHADYVNQASSYQPVAGYIASGRAITSGDFTYRANHWLSMFASASVQDLSSIQYMQGTSFHGTAEGGGALVTLPSNTTLSVQYTGSSYESGESATAPQTSDQIRQYSLIASHNFKKQTLHFIGMQLGVSGTSKLQQTSEEFQDDWRLKWFVLSGSVRLENTLNANISTKNVYFRGGIQGTIKNISYFGRFDQGSDLASTRTLLASQTRSGSFGVRGTIKNGWKLSLDAWRSTLTTSLVQDPAISALFSGSYLPTLLALNQWTVFTNLTKELHWGKGSYAGMDVGRYAELATPRLGVIEGKLTSMGLAKVSTLAGGIPVLLDGFRRATSDRYGMYVFSAVPEGPHFVEIDERHLPVDFLLVDRARHKTSVDGKRIAREDFTLKPAAGVCGSIQAEDVALLEGLLVRLDGTDMYTMVDPDGKFCLDGIPEGNYTAMVQTRGTEQLIFKPEKQDITVTAGAIKTISFKVDKKTVVKPIKQVEVAK